MNKEEIMKLAERAGASQLSNVPGFEDFLVHFFILAGKAEREECAKIAEDEWMNYSALNEAHQRLSSLPFNPNNFDIDMSIALKSKHIADLIRDRGNT
jgi:hypothetical protein